ncbi:MAG TPA: hypothetical protein VK848_13145 [Acidimicrobiia bacterium]|nr:hypothetical protein [Acidimicrobiia bacterium]
MAAMLLVAAPAPPVRAATGPFQIGLIGDTGYSPRDDGNLLKVRASANASGLAFVVHDGDTHHYRLDHPWKDAPNLTRLETYPGFTPQWVKATVSPSSPAVFSFVTMRG